MKDRDYIEEREKEMYESNSSNSIRVTKAC